MTYLLNNKIQYQDSASNDAFGRLRVSNLYTLFDSKQIGHAHNEMYDVELSGGSTTYVQSGASTLLTVTGASGSYVIRQSKQRLNYQTGKGALIILTGVYSQQTGTTKRIGYFDSYTTAPYLPYNGIYFEVTGTDISVNIVKNGVVNSVSKSNWNVDKMDGTGVFKKTLDMSKSQIFVMDAEWLGVGRVRFGFNIDGLTYYVHEFQNANNIVGVYSQYLNLPIRYEIRSTGGSGSIEQICSTVASEGGLDPVGIYRTIKRDTALTINSVYRPILAFRLKQGSTMGGTLLDAFSILGTAATDYYYSLKFYGGDELVNINGTPTAWSGVTFTGITNSFCEFKNDFDTTYLVNTTTDNGITLAGGFVSNQVRASAIGQLKSSINLGAKINGTRDVIVLEVLTFANNSLYSSLTWREI